MLQLRDGVVPTQAVVDGLTGYLRDRIAGYKLPRRFEFVDELPRTPTGKLVKGELRRQLTDPH